MILSTQNGVIMDNRGGAPNDQFFLDLIENGCGPTAHLRHRDSFFAKELPFYTYVGNNDINDGLYTKEFQTGEVHLVKRVVDAELNVEETFLKVLRSAAA
jgi:hypothetical protein